MAKRSLLVVGLSLPWKNAEYVEITSKRSLADGDIIVICPTILTEFYTSDSYLGDPCFDDDTSFKIRECISHWRNEVSAALTAGKTVIVILGEKEKFQIGTGRREYSGTGRNRQTTRIVEPGTNYSMLPLQIQDLKNSSGTKIKREPRIWPIENYWRIMESSSRYTVTYAVEAATPLLKTVDGARVVGSVLHEHGYFVLVPDLILPDELESETNVDEDGEPIWTPEAEELARRLEAAFAVLDADRREIAAITPPPDWVAADLHRLPAEQEIESKIRDASIALERMHEEHRNRTTELEHYVEIKALLYEKGARLEEAVISALKELGFQAESYRTAENEFDVVFSADGDRYLGEIEGRDDNAIHVDKISQLERNIQEDFERDDVEQHAIGVLFGNGYRLKKLEERDEFFTEKVKISAVRSGIRLVRTPDLFRAVQLFRKTRDTHFAGRCRSAIRDQKGTVVEFPQK